MFKTMVNINDKLFTMSTYNSNMWGPGFTNWELKWSCVAYDEDYDDLKRYRRPRQYPGRIGTMQHRFTTRETTKEKVDEQLALVTCHCIRGFIPPLTFDKIGDIIYKDDRCKKFHYKLSWIRADNAEEISELEEGDWSANEEAEYPHEQEEIKRLKAEYGEDHDPRSETDHLYNPEDLPH